MKHVSPAVAEFEVERLKAVNAELLKACEIALASIEDHGDEEWPTAKARP